LKIVNIARIKRFVEDAAKRLPQGDPHSSQGGQRLSQGTLVFFKANRISLPPDLSLELLKN
jgi:hypothetical protein